jgi:para-nitrobenzyl esterase
VPGGSTDEDCLHLNVTTPDGAGPAHPRPVIVWLHGGGFTTGAGSSYDAHRMATRGDVVVVTVNYRLGALGFLAHSGLPGSGTFGLADQQAALRWVRAEISAFGGEAHNVTLAGESAGGYSVCAQLASPAAAGLFDRALIESGPCTGRPGRPFAPSSVPLFAARAAGAGLAAKVGCGSARDVMACLRRVDVSRLLASQDTDQQPAYTTPLLPRDPAAAITDGRFHRVPVLIGNNHDEGNGWAAGIIQAAIPSRPSPGPMSWPPSSPPRGRRRRSSASTRCIAPTGARSLDHVTQRQKLSGCLEADALVGLSDQVTVMRVLTSYVARVGHYDLVRD